MPMYTCFKIGRKREGRKKTCCNCLQIPTDVYSFSLVGILFGDVIKSGYIKEFAFFKSILSISKSIRRQAKERISEWKSC